MADRFSTHQPGLTAPATRAAAVAPSDDTDLPFVSRALRVGTTAGAIKLTTVAGDVVTIPGVQIGETLPIRAKRVWENGTSAEGITALW